MFKNDLEEYNELQKAELQKHLEILDKVHKLVDSIFEKYSMQPMHSEDVSPQNLWIKVRIHNIAKFELPTELINDLTKAMHSEKSLVTILDGKLELTFSY
jgi:hypothetical protein